MEANWTEALKIFVIFFVMLLGIDVLKLVFRKNGQQSVSKEVLNIRNLIVTALGAFVGAVVYLFILLII